MPTNTTAMQPPLFIVSVATGYGGAERNIEILLPYLLASRKVVVFACNPYHLERLACLAQPNLEVHQVDASASGFEEAAAHLLTQRYTQLWPSAILANTLDSLRIVSRATVWLPALDSQTCFFAHDLLWTDYEHLLPSMARATLLVPDRSVLEKRDYLGRHAWPHGTLRALVVPTPVEIPAEAPPAPAADAPFLHLATVNGFKGHHRLAEAAAILHRSCPGLRIDSHGHRPTPDLYADLLNHVDAVGAAGTLSLHEHAPDPSQLLHQSRAVLVTSVTKHGGPETFGRTIIEAWAHGRPVIAFACGAPARLIRHEVDGLLVDEGDVQGLARAIERLHRDPALADRLGREGRARVQREFACAVVLSQWLPVLEGQWRPGLRPPRLANAQAHDASITYLDVSHSLENGWNPPVGISRVEQQAGDMLVHRKTPVRLVRRGADDGGYRCLTAQELEFLGNRTDGIGSLAAQALASSAPPPRRRALPIGRSIRLLGALGHGVGARLPAQQVRRRLQTRIEASAQVASGEAPHIRPGKGDVFVSVSNPWDYVPAPVFQAMRAEGVRVILVVHDLMVWETPQWTAGRDAREYSHNMISVIAEANALVAVSRHTAQSTARALAESGRAVPGMRVAHPAGLSPAALPFGGPPPGFDPRRPFVVYCSTIEMRKNHGLLLQVWDRLRQTLPPQRLPTLVFAGRWGWCVDQVRLAVERNWRLAPHLHVATDVRDEQLLWLYRHARFCVFPSFTEGYGLPVAESLSVGTPVVVADHPALHEASRGTMPAVDSGDLPGWLRQIEQLCMDDDLLAQLREKARDFRTDPHELAGALALAGEADR